jgi:hypothetical protein
MNDLGQDLRSPLIQIKLASWLRGQGQRGWAPTSTKRMPPTAAAGTATRTTVEVWLAARTQVRSGNKVSAAVYRGRKKRPQPIGGALGGGWGRQGLPIWGIGNVRPKHQPQHLHSRFWSPDSRKRASDQRSPARASAGWWGRSGGSASADHPAQLEQTP